MRRNIELHEHEKAKGAQRVTDNELLSILLEESTDRALIASAPDGSGIEWNSSLERIFGHTEESVGTLTISSLFMPGERLPVPGENTRSWCQRADGRVFPAVAAVRKSESRSSFIWVFRDLSLGSDEREHERKFISVLAHDLREPLNSVYGFTQLLMKKCAGKLTADENQYLELVKTAAQRMNGMIVALQDLNRLDATPPEESEVDTSVLVSESERSLKQTIAEKKVEISRGSLPTIRGTPVQVGQLFTELLANAIRFGESKGAVRIHVGAIEQGARQWLFEVRDGGAGIDKDRLEKIFVPFVRGGGPEAGRGLGLAICRRIVERHGGRIWAESDAATSFAIKFVWPR